jgi:preprotein translocase subunit YajC
MLDVFDPLSFFLLAQDGGGGAPSGGSGLVQLMPLILVLMVLFYLMVARPANRQRAEMQKLLENIKKNDEVLVLGAVHGKVVNAPHDSEFIYLQLDESSNARLKVLRSSVTRNLTAEKAAEKEKAGEKSEVKEKKGDII